MADSSIAQDLRAVEALKDSFASLRDISRGVSADMAQSMRASTAEIRQADRQAQSLSRSMSSGLRRAFDQAVFGGEKLSGVMKNLALDMSRTVLSNALAPVQQAIGGGMNAAIQGGLSSLFSGSFADGGAFTSGRVRAFAKGGVVSGATAFPMRGGTGLMGEAGPEAIMPLTRGADGKLGVRSDGGANQTTVTVNIRTPDAESFQRSRGQVSASIARAVQRGQRNM